MKILCMLMMLMTATVYGSTTGTVYRVVQIDTNGVLVNAGTNLVARNGIATTGSVALVAQAAAASLSTGAAAQVTASMALSTGQAAQASADLAMATGQAARVVADAAMSTGVAAQAAADLAMATGQASRVAADAAMATGMAAQAAADALQYMTNKQDAITTPASAFTWVTNGGLLQITGYTGTDPYVVIPALLGGMPVRQINNAFQNNATFSEVILPETLVSIGVSAFNNCKALEKITIPKSVTIINGGAFAGCTNLYFMYYNGDAPAESSYMFDQVPGTNYVLNPLSTGWGSTYGGKIVVRPKLQGSASDLTGCPSGALPTNGVTWRTNTFITAIYTNESGAVTGKTEQTIIYLGQP